MRLRSIAAVCGATLATLATLALTACSVPITGVTGVTRTEQGGLEAVVSMCEGTVHVAALSYDTSDDRHFVAEWPYTAAVSTHGTVALSPDPTGQLRPGIIYSIDSWSNNNSAIAFGPDVTADDLNSLAPGEILSTDFRGEGVPFTAVLSEAEFDDSVQSFCER